MNEHFEQTDNALLIVTREDNTLVNLAFWDDDNIKEIRAKEFQSVWHEPNEQGKIYELTKPRTDGYVDLFVSVWEDTKTKELNQYVSKGYKLTLFDESFVLEY